MRKIFDLHNDYLTSLKKRKKCDKYLKKAANCSIISSIFTSEMNDEQSIANIESGFQYINEYKKNVQSDCQKSIFLGIEDLHFITKNNLLRVINCCPEYCSLTWNYNNNLAGGASEGGDLTLLGIDVAQELESAGIFVDTAHLAEKSFMSFSKITTKPILCSHTAVNSLVNHNRNLKDYQIKMIVESGGLMGIALVSTFLSGEKTSTISDIARHIDYVVSRYGDDNICLGTDFYGTKKLPKGIKSYQSLQLLEDRLKFLGYGEETIDKIFYKNAETFFAKNY